jgi:hypothetical protein
VEKNNTRRKNVKWKKNRDEERKEKGKEEENSEDKRAQEKWKVNVDEGEENNDER